MTTHFKILGDNDRKELLKKLNEQFGITKVNGTLLTLGQDKVRLLTADISPDNLDLLGSIVHVEISGFYLLKIEKDGIRLSHDAVNILRGQITKNIININSEQEIGWLKGHDVLLNKEQEVGYNNTKGFIVLKSDNELIGCGKLGNDGRIRNFVPKERRVK